MITLNLLLVIGILAGAAAVVDGIIRVRGRGTPVLAVIEIIVGALFLISLFVAGVPLGTTVLGVVLLIVLILQLVLRGSTRRSGVGITVVGLILLAIYLVLAQGWIVVPGVNA